jgi:hypothetical protein
MKSDVGLVREGRGEGGKKGGERKGRKKIIKKRKRIVSNIYIYILIHTHI